MTRRNRRLTSWSGLIALAMHVGCCAGAVHAATAIKVAMINSNDMLAFYVAADQGLFEKRGLKVEGIAVANTSVVVSSIVAGSAEIGFAVPPVMLQAKENGIDLVVVGGGTRFPGPKNYAGILARTGTAIKSASDLIGKKVGVLGLKSFHHVMVRRWLEEQNVDPDKVTFVEVGFAQASDLMKSGKIDAAVTVAPFYNRMIDEKVGYVFDDYLKTVPDGMPIDFYVSSKEWADAHQEAASAFRSALQEAIELIAVDEADARKSLAKWTNLPAAVVSVAPIPMLSVEVTEPQMQWWVVLAKKAGLISGTLTGGDLLVNQTKH